MSRKPGTPTPDGEQSDTGKHGFNLLSFMNPRRFLFLGGTVLAVLGASGIAGLLGSIAAASLFNPPYWINWFHLAAGICVLAVALGGGSTVRAAVTLLAASMGSTLGLLGLLLRPYAARQYSLPELADPSDHLAHLTVGLVAFGAWLNRHADRRGAFD